LITHRLRHQERASLTLEPLFIVNPQVSSVYSATSVTLAVAQTAAVVLSLSLYAWQPSAARDLSGLGSALGSGLVVLSSAAVLTRVFGFGGGDVAVSSAAALLFGGFIVFDTKRICEGTLVGILGLYGPYPARDSLNSLWCLYVAVVVSRHPSELFPAQPPVHHWCHGPVH
jgi:FtsH-binding integral membrane protein